MEVTAPARLYLIDGYAMIYRAFFAMIDRPLTNADGLNVSAPYGVARILHRILKEEPDYIAFVMDAGSSGREELFADYKATRAKMPDDLRASIPVVERIVEAMGIRIVRVEGFEADDVIGTLAIRASQAGMDAYIVSGDKDFAQLIRPGISLYQPASGRNAVTQIFNTENGHERLGVAPYRVVDYLSLLGDSSDNVPGAKGIGKKTAVDLIEQFDSVEAMIASAESIKGKRTREALLTCADQIRLSKQLVTIRTDVEVPYPLEIFRRDAADVEHLTSVLAESGLPSLARDFGSPAPSAKSPPKADPEPEQMSFF